MSRSWDKKSKIPKIPKSQELLPCLEILPQSYQVKHHNYTKLFGSWGKSCYICNVKQKFKTMNKETMIHLNAYASIAALLRDNLIN